MYICIRFESAIGIRTNSKQNPIRPNSEFRCWIRLHMVWFCFCLRAGKWILCNCNWTNCRLLVAVAVVVAPWSATILKISVAMMMHLQFAICKCIRSSTQCKIRSFVELKSSSNNMACEWILRNFWSSVQEICVHPASQSHHKISINRLPQRQRQQKQHLHVQHKMLQFMPIISQPRICNS